MKKYVWLMFFLWISFSVYAQDAVISGLVLSKAPIDRTDLDSIKRGAQFFSKNCMSCHTMVYLRYDRLARDAGVVYERMPVNVKAWPNGIAPPDLSLIESVRGVDWLYTYLHSFYKDPARPTGFNNLLRPNTAMPNILNALQGEQLLVLNPSRDLFGHYEWYDLIALNKDGQLTPEAFDKTMADLVNFMAYAAEPYYQTQRSIGFGVLIFLAIFFIFAALLKKSYWKDVKKYKEK